MDRIVKSLLLMLLGVFMFAWFVYSINYPPAMSETYQTDWIMTGVKLIGAIAALAGGILALKKK